MISRAWWVLSFRWLWGDGRAPRVKRGLFKGSIRVACFSLAMGVGTLSLTMAVMSGFETTLMERVGRASGDIVWPMRSWRTFDELEGYLKTLPQSGYRAEAFWSSQGLLVGPKAGRGVWIEGRNDLTRSAEILPETSSSEVKISLGQALAKILGVGVGDLVQLRLPGVLDRVAPARVVDLLSYGMYEIDARAAIVDDLSLRAYLQSRDPQLLAKRPGDAHGLRFFFDRDQDPEDFKSKAEEALLSVLPLDQVELLGVKEQKANLFRGIGYNKRELGLILGLLTLVAGLNVAASLVILFLERDRDFALIQAVGASRQQLFVWISTLGLLLGVAGSGIGLLLGRLMGLGLQALPWAKIPPEIYNLSVLPLHYKASEQTWLFFGGVASALVCAAVLALSLARMNLVGVLGAKR